MSPQHIIYPFVLLCATARAHEGVDTANVTDPSKIVSSTTYDLGDRLMTVQEVTKDILPIPPKHPLPTPVSQITDQQLADEVTSDEGGTLMMGGTVFLSISGQPRTLITYHSPVCPAQITFWSSADWRLLTNVGPLRGQDGKTWDLMLMLSQEEYPPDADPEHSNQQLVIPNFSAGKSTYKIVTGTPSAQVLSQIELFHAKYDSDYEQLKADFQKREEEQKKRDAELKAHPPDKKNIVLRFRMLEPSEISAPSASPTE